MKQYTVTGRARTFKQPGNGFIPAKSLQVKQFKTDDLGFINLTAAGQENISPAKMGLMVDYLTRYQCLKASKNTDSYAIKVIAFQVPLMGAELLQAYYFNQGLTDKQKSVKKEVVHLINAINDVSEFATLDAVCRLLKYDAVYRAGIDVFNDQDDDIDIDTMKHVQAMVNRSLNYLDHEAASATFLKVGFDLLGSFSKIVTSGDGDYLTSNALIDSKVSKYKPNKQYTLQILMYYLMGLHSDDANSFKNMKKLVLFYPRQNIEYSIKVSDLDENMLKTVETDVIGY